MGTFEDTSWYKPDRGRDRVEDVLTLLQKIYPCEDGPGKYLSFVLIADIT